MKNMVNYLQISFDPSNRHEDSVLFETFLGSLYSCERHIYAKFKKASKLANNYFILLFQAIKL